MVLSSHPFPLLFIFFTAYSCFSSSNHTINWESGTDYVQNRRIIIISRLTLLDEHFPNRNRPFKLFKSQDCCNVWEYQKGTYYRDMRWILKYKVKIDIFLPEMLCIVVLAAENGETEKFEGFHIQSFDIPIHFLLIWVGALCSILLFSSNSLQQRHMVSRYYIKYLLLYWPCRGLLLPVQIWSF